MIVTDLRMASAIVLANCLPTTLASYVQIFLRCRFKMKDKLKIPWMHNGGSFEPDCITEYVKNYAGAIVMFENGDYFVNYIPKTGPISLTVKVPQHVWCNGMHSTNRR